MALQCHNSGVRQQHARNRYVRKTSCSLHEYSLSQFFLFELVNRETETALSRSRRASVNGLRLAVDKIVHHNDVPLWDIIDPRGRTDCDPDTGDSSIIKNDSEKRLIAVSR